MEVNIDSKAIQEAVVRAVADSTVGESIKGAIQEALTKREGFSSETLLHKAIKNEVAKTIASIVKDILQNRREEMHKAVSAQITDEILAEMTDTMWRVMLEGMRKTY